MTKTEKPPLDISWRNVALIAGFGAILVTGAGYFIWQALGG
jgi:hypothetical protein